MVPPARRGGAARPQPGVAQTPVAEAGGLRGEVPAQAVARGRPQAGTARAGGLLRGEGVAVCVQPRLREGLAGAQPASLDPSACS